MIQVAFENIDKAAIDALVTNNVSEDRTLDYKETLPGGTDSEKKEFLADVSSFANASGGDLIYGVKEKRDGDGKATGEPEIACGLAGVNADVEIRRLDSIIRDSIDPRIAGIRMKPVEDFPNGTVIVLRIPKSWSSPHMVKTSSRFYSRDNRGKYPLDVQEIRAAFAVSESLPERIRRFRDDRLAKIIANECPIPLIEGAKIVLHVLPVASFEPTTNLDVPNAIRRIPNNSIHPMRSHGWTPRHNFDGYLWFTGPPSSTGCYPSYTQLFRSGAIEMVEASMLQPVPQTKNAKLIPSVAFEQELVCGLQRCLDSLKALELQPPVFVMLSLLGVKGYLMWKDGLWGSMGLSLIDRNDLLLPESLVETYTERVETILRPMFDGVWQASGADGSPNYDKDGNWKTRG